MKLETASELRQTIKFIALPFMFSRELYKILSFHVVVVHKWGTYTQKARCSCKAVALLTKLAAFLTFLLP